MPLANGVVGRNVKPANNAITTNLNTGTPFSQLISPDITNAGGTIPKAYLNIVFFDERFRFVEESSTSLRVGSQGANTLALTNIKAPKNGYCFAYISNESSINVFFDNFKVRHDRGRIIEENHYYAYGLKIAPLSSKAYGAPNNNYTYQGDYNEFDADLGWHDFALRSYDPQTGRFLQNDPYEQFSSGYIGMGNDPVNMIDPSGGFGNGIGCAATAGMSGFGGAAGNMAGGFSQLANLGTALGMINTLLRIGNAVLTPRPVAPPVAPPAGTNPGNSSYWRRTNNGTWQHWENTDWKESDWEDGFRNTKSIQPPGYIQPPKFNPNNRIDRAMRDGMKSKLERQTTLPTAEEDEPDKRRDVFYITYTKTRKNDDGSETVFTGRTRGYGEMTEDNAMKYIRIRDYGHHKKAGGFGPAAFDKMSRSWDAIRGREQQMIDDNGGAYKDMDYRRGTSPGSSGNDIRGVRKNRGRGYHDKATGEFGQKFWYTGN